MAHTQDLKCLTDIDVRPIIEELSASSTFYFQNDGTSNVSISAHANTAGILWWSFDKQIWTPVSSDQTDVESLRPGEKVWFRGTATPSNIGMSGSYDTVFTISPSSARVSVHGRLSDLCPRDYMNDYAFYKLFNRQPIWSAKDLIFPDRVGKCGCADMFYYCRSLEEGPTVLPAMTLGEECYSYMFYNCDKLVVPPALPATVVPRYGYNYMFNNCTRLAETPDLSHVTKITAIGCQGMFAGCSSLTAVTEFTSLTTVEGNGCSSMFSQCTALVDPPSILPPTTLSSSCYPNMFYRCTALIAAPVLPAPTLLSNSYNQMFYGCTSLQYIKCLATNANNSYMPNWVNGVSSSGTFVKKTGSTWPSGVSGIPSGWTVQEASS